MKNRSLNYEDKFYYYIIFSIFVLVSIGYFYVHNLDFNFSEHSRKLWASCYQIIAILGGVIGLLISRKWNGFKSIMGRSIVYFSLGLFFQVLGQSINSYYNIFKGVDIPYPSLGDLGFMSSVVFYIIGAYTLAKVSGLSSSFKNIRGKIFTVVIPIIIILLCYFIFLQGYEFDWSNKIKIFLDFGYPFGQAIYVSTAIIIFMLSKSWHNIQLSWLNLTLPPLLHKVRSANF